MRLCANGCAVWMLREEVQLLQEPGSSVGEVVKVMGKTKVLVKVRHEAPASVFGAVHHESSQP
jgi:ATP-dependent 26S proteasome regulatory subunit